MARRAGQAWWLRKTRKTRKRIGQLKESQEALKLRRRRGSDF